MAARRTPRLQGSLLVTCGPPYPIDGGCRHYTDSPLSFILASSPCHTLSLPLSFSLLYLSACRVLQTATNIDASRYWVPGWGRRDTLDAVHSTDRLTTSNWARAMLRLSIHVCTYVPRPFYRRLAFSRIGLLPMVSGGGEGFGISANALRSVRWKSRQIQLSSLTAKLAVL